MRREGFMSFRLSEPERQLITSAAESAGVPVTVYVRQAARERALEQLTADEAGATPRTLAATS